ncbi:hypothetical protein, partial [Roseovarius aquimarinus]|uniref:hypothetical protein n=1 Tax=Roseovarius aquimarinus TaxID=1229156 RepID=UPI003645C8CF
KRRQSGAVSLDDGPQQDTAVCPPPPQQADAVRDGGLSGRTNVSTSQDRVPVLARLSLMSFFPVTSRHMRPLAAVGSMGFRKFFPNRFPAHCAPFNMIEFLSALIPLRIAMTGT